MTPSYKYFAFISYSRKDSKAAAWLQKRLEWFRVPVKLVEAGRRPPHARYVRPIYRDKTHLEVTDEHYWKNIRTALEESRYLIVLSSPQAAASEPVDMEVVHFLSTHGGDASLVVPVILGGSVMSAGTDAALCPALRALGEALTSRNLPKMVPDFDTAELDAWEQGFVELISYLLKLERTAIGDHIQRETRRQKRVLQRWLVSVVVLGFLAVMGGFFWWRQFQETARQLDRASVEVGRSWLERARTAQKAGDHLTALMLAGRSVGFAGYGREHAGPEWQEKFQPLLGQKMEHDAAAEAERGKEHEEVKKFISTTHPSLLPIWSSPVEAQHEGGVSCVAFSPDGKRLATASSNQTVKQEVKLWDTTTGQHLISLKGQTTGVMSVAFSPDGRRLATAGDPDVKLWDSATGEEQATFTGHQKTVTCVAFSPDGTRVASASEDKTVKLWDSATGKVLHTLAGHTQGVTSVAFSPDGKRLASGSWDQLVKLWDSATGKELSTLKGHPGSVSCVAFSPDGTCLASGSDNTYTTWEQHDHTVKLWDCATGKLLGTLAGHTWGVKSVAFSPDGKSLASGSSDYTVRLWNMATRKERATLTGHRGQIYSVAFSPDGKRVASGAFDQKVKMWDSATGKELAPTAAHQDDISSVAFSPDGTRLASGSKDGTMKLWDCATGKLLASLTNSEPDTRTGQLDEITCVAFSPDGTRVASVSSGTVKLWDSSTGKELTTLKGPSGCVAFSPDGTRLASWSFDKTVKLWDLATGRELATYTGHRESVSSVAFSPDGLRVACASDDKIRLWNCDTGMEVATLTGHRGYVASVAFSPDGRLVASGSGDKTVKLWDSATGMELRTFIGHQGTVSSVAFSPDGTRLVSVSVDNTVKIWDSATGEELASGMVHMPPASGMAHMAPATCVAFSPDIRRLASGSDDDTVKLWDCATGEELSSLSGHTEEVNTYAFSPDGTRLASGSDDETVKLWDSATGKELATLKGHETFIYSVAFSPDGTRLASGSGYLTLSGTPAVKLWDCATGRELATLAGNRGDVTCLAFSPDGTRLASKDSYDNVRLWDTATYKELTGPVDFPLDDLSSSLRLRAHIPGKIVHLYSTKPKAPDLLHFQREGLFELKEREIAWLTNSSLRSAQTFTPQHYRDDELAALAAPNLTAAAASALRLQLLARSSQWRAARAWWAAEGKMHSAELLRPYLTLLLTCALDARTRAAEAAQTELTAEITERLTAESTADLRIALPLAQHLLRLAADEELCPEALWSALASKVHATTTTTWQQNVAAMAEVRLKGNSVSAAARQRLELLMHNAGQP